MFEEEIKNKLELDRRIQEELGLVEYLTDDEMTNLGVEKLRQILNTVKQISEDVARKKLLETDRYRLVSRLKRLEKRLMRAINLYEQIHVDVIVKVDKESMKANMPVKINLILKNHNPFEVQVKLQEMKLKGVSLITMSHPTTLSLRPRSIERVTLLFKKLENELIIGPFRILCRGQNIERKIFVDPVIMKTEVPKPILRVVKDVDKTKVKEGEELEVKLIIKNEGDGIAKGVYLKDNTNGLKVRGITEWTGDLAPGASKSISYRVVADKDLKLLKPAIVTFKDESGKQIKVQSNSVNVEVIPIEHVKTETEEEQVKPLKHENVQKISIDEIIDEIGKLGLLTLTGYSLASLIPKKRKIPKKVIIEKDIHWTTWKQDNEEIIIILEHPVAIVKEEYQDFIRFRKATPVEIFHSVDRTTARRLQETFIYIMKGILTRWRPNEADGVKIEELYEDQSYKKICKELKKRKLNNVPRNPMLICTYYRKKSLFRKETVMKVYVKTCANIRQLYFNEVDHVPMSFSSSEISDLVKEISQAPCPIIVFLGSPTGWDENTKKFAKETYNPMTHLVFVDLKTFERYFNEKDDLLMDLCSFLPQIAPEEVSAEEVDERLEKLDSLLLDGTLTLEEYARRVKKLKSEKILRNIRE
ncbi:MAG: hypothetical protein B6U95_03865 [Thermofilum sp. ex4484_82]|nr:MAG: hypothetical protein B6U95_03865 [Thermofilum sp. ex4484_82]OYT38658.1 MAG: hypothetical protein B6U96_03860 [Archaeoglobales archaeon ex4484_92]